MEQKGNEGDRHFMSLCPCKMFCIAQLRAEYLSKAVQVVCVSTDNRNTKYIFTQAMGRHLSYTAH